MLSEIALIVVSKLLLVALLAKLRRAATVEVVRTIIGIIQLAAVDVIGVKVVPINVVGVEVVAIDVVDVDIIQVRIVEVTVVVVVAVHESIRIRNIRIVVVHDGGIVPAGSP